MALDDIHVLLEVIALVLAAYALVMKTIADQPTRYPPEAVDGLSAAIGIVLASGMILIAQLLYTSRLARLTTLAAVLIASSFIAMIYAVWHFRRRQEELEETPEEDEDTASKQPAQDVEDS